MLGRELAARQFQRIRHAAHIPNRRRNSIDAGQEFQLQVDEGHVKLRIVDDEFGALHKFEKVDGNFREPGFRFQPLQCQAVHFKRAVVDGSFRVDVAMEPVAGQMPVHDFYRANLHDAMSALGFESSRFRVQDYLAHDPPSIASMASFAARSTRSLSSTPLWPLTHSHST